MKTLAVLFALLSLLILVPNPTHCIRINNNPIRLPSAAYVALASDGTPVVDMDGNVVQAGEDYYVFTPNPAPGGTGVRLLGWNSGGDTQCPTDIILSNGLPANPIIITPKEKDTQVLESSPQNLKFKFTNPLCEKKVFWDIDYDYESGQQIVKAGSDLVYEFSIVRDAKSDAPLGTYNIIHCSFGVCYNVSTYQDKSIGATRLALSRETFLPVMFLKLTQPVLDDKGDEVLVGQQYNILSIVEPEGEVAVVGLDEKTECPGDVVIRNEVGDPILFTQGGPIPYVLESTLLAVEFEPTQKCKKSLYWEHSYDFVSKQTFVKAAPLLLDRFRIERVPSLPGAHFYKITFCSTTCYNVMAYEDIYCPSEVCYNLSTYYDESIDATRLVFGGDSVLEVVFQKRTPPVLDADGAELLAGEVYNIVSVDEPEGEVALVQLNTTAECPRDVIIQEDNGSGEDRIVFSPAGPNPFVWESTFLSVEFSPLQPNPDCQNSLSWDIQNDPQSGQDIVKTGNNILKLFKIERVLSPPGIQFYKITYCRDTECKNVGSYEDPSANNANRLALSDDVLPVVFKKATSVSTLCHLPTKMKTLSLLFALSLYLLLPNPTHSTRNPIRLPTADIVVASDTPVRDTNGDEVRTSGAYFLMSASPETPGEVIFGLFNNNNTKCPSDVVLWKEEFHIPIKIITPADPDATVVLELTTSLNFKFDTPLAPPCDKNVTWEAQYDFGSELGFVKTGDIVSYPFRILPDQAPNTYRIIYCSNLLLLCYNVGTYYDKTIGQTRLVVGDGDYSPLIVEFQYVYG
nr:sporamin B [Ipomoea batatas]